LLLLLLEVVVVLHVSRPMLLPLLSQLLIAPFNLRSL
jgi:hypothetical protein